jgi:hypothetical protein
MKNSMKDKHFTTSLTNQNINLSESSHYTKKIVKTEKKNSFFWIFYISFTLANTLLASFLVYKLNKLLISTKNSEVLYFLISYIMQLIISSIFSIIIYLIILLIQSIVKISSNSIKFKDYFLPIFRVVTALISLVLATIGFYFLIRMSKKETKEYKLNFHENYFLLYIFILCAMTISIMVIVFTIYYFVIIYLRLNKKKLDIDEEFIQNIQDELNLSKKKNSSFVPPSDEFIKETQRISKEIKEMKAITLQSEDNKNMNFNDFDIPRQESNLDLKKVIETEKKRIKNDIFESTANKDRRKESLMDEIKKEIQFSNSPEKKPHISEFKFEDASFNKPVLNSVDTFKL